jgi:hypothetical protein
VFDLANSEFKKLLKSGDDILNRLINALGKFLNLYHFFRKTKHIDANFK